MAKLEMPDYKANKIVEGMGIKPKELHDFITETHYPVKDPYIPQAFALFMLQFIKMVHMHNPSENKTPVMHLKMLDNFVSDKENTINVCHRGAAKSTLKHYLILMCGCYGQLPFWGPLDYGLYVSDSIDNGVKKMRKSLETSWDMSPFLQEMIPDKKFTDTRWEFINADGKHTVFTGHGAQSGVRGPLALDSKVYTDTGTKTIAEVEVGDEIYTPQGLLTKVTGKSPVFHDDMYELTFADGRVLRCDGTHLHPMYIRDYSAPRKNTKYKKVLVTTLDMLKGKPIKSGTLHRYFTQLIEPVQYTVKEFQLDPYLVGLLLGDGFIQEGKSARLSGLRSDVEEYLTHLPTCEVSSTDYLERSGMPMKRVCFSSTLDCVRELGMSGIVDYQKSIPELYMYGSVNQRKELLAGLLDTDGSCTKEGYVQYSTVSKQLAEDIVELARSLGCRATLGVSVRDTTRRDLYRINITAKFNPFKLQRKADRYKVTTRWSDRIALVSIKPIADEPSQCIRVEDAVHEFITDSYLATHNTRELNMRPQLALLDDLLSDEDARSKTCIASVEDTIYNAIMPALHPEHRKIIWSGTPFSMADPLTKAVGSGAWEVNVYPVCEKFPCSEDEFRSSWPDRFKYKFVLGQYEMMKANGKIDAFYQEYMLQVVSDEDRVVDMNAIQWYPRADLLRNKQNFNFYITTDFATTEEDYGDDSVQIVWAYNNLGQWFIVDGFAKPVGMDVNINRLFEYVQMYKPLATGIEISGQQKGFIPWIKEQMMVRNIFFTLAKDEGSTKEGLSPKGKNKLSRFQVTAPMINAGMLHLPIELKDSPFIVAMLHQLGLVTYSGIKCKKDDILDGISQVSKLRPWKPSAAMDHSEGSGFVGDAFAFEEAGAMDSYIV